MRPRPLILVAEYNPAIAELIQEILEAHGFAVAGPAHTVPDALALCERGEFDGAVLDLILGGSFCHEVINALASQCVPLLFFSYYGSEVLPSGMRSHRLLRKPEGILELAEAASETFRLVSVPQTDAGVRPR